MTISNSYDNTGCGCNSFITNMLEKAGRQLWQYQNFLKLSMGSNKLVDSSNSFAASMSSSAASEETSAIDNQSVDQTTLNEIPGVYSNSQNPMNRFRVGGVKLIVDGSIQGYTAFLRDPYWSELSKEVRPLPDKCSDKNSEQMFLSIKTDDGKLPSKTRTTTLPGTIASKTLRGDTGNPDEPYRGYASMTQEQMTQWVQDCDARNIQILVHTNGDAAIDILLNAIKKVRQVDSLRDLRTTIIHAQTIQDDQLDDAKDYGLIPSFFPIHISFWGDRHKELFLGPKRAKRISPAKSALNRGLKFTLHHDAPIAGIGMLPVAAAAVNRMTYDQNDEPHQVLGKKEKVTAFEALRGITANAAWQYFEEDHKGTLEIGKRADLVILSEDPLAVDPMKMKDIEVLATIKDGQPIYSNPERPPIVAVPS